MVQKSVSRDPVVLWTSRARQALLPLALGMAASCDTSPSSPTLGTIASEGQTPAGVTVTASTGAVTALTGDVFRVRLSTSLNRARVVSWKLSDTSVATVSSSGLVRAVGEGVAVLAATANGVEERTNLRVTRAASVEIVAPKVALVAGEQMQLRARVVTTGGDSIAPAAPTWRVAEGVSVQVNSDGLVTAVSSGTSRIEVAAGEASSFIEITVGRGAEAPEIPRVTRVIISPKTLSLAPGATATFTARAEWSDGVTRVTPITFASTGGSVSQGGVYTAAQFVGAFIVTATCSCGRADTATVSLSAAAPPPPPPSAGVELPRVFLGEMLAASRQAPPTRTISVTSAAALQRALDTARFGDHILLQPGVVYSGSFVLRAKTGTGWITIRSAAPDAQLPVAGQRIRPSNAGLLPKLVPIGTNAAAILTEPGAQGYRLFALEIAPAASATEGFALVSLGDGSDVQNTAAKMPSRIVLDRVYVHGHNTFDFKRCISLQSASTAIVDSWISECHSRGFDAQAIAGWNGSGPYMINNNYLEGSGENVLFGGADPFVVGNIPADIEFRRNHLFKPLSWQGGTWLVKNSLELKAGLRLLIEDNVIENNWAHGQVGFALMFYSVNQGGNAPWSEVRDVTFRYNIVRNSAHGANLAATYPGTPAVPMSKLTFANNLFERIGTGDFEGGRLWQVTSVSDLTFEYNTGIARTHGAYLFGAAQRLTMIGNIFGTTGADDGAVSGSYGFGAKALSDIYGTSWVFRNNVVPGATAATFPASNSYPASIAAIGFQSYPQDVRLLSSSPFGPSTPGGQPSGADISQLLARTLGVVVPN